MGVGVQRLVSSTKVESSSAFFTIFSLTNKTAVLIDFH